MGLISPQFCQISGSGDGLAALGMDSETVLGWEAGSLSHGDFFKVNRIIQNGVGRFILGFRKEVGGRGT